jgi:hypothetical protein
MLADMNKSGPATDLRRHLMRERIIFWRPAKDGRSVGSIFRFCETDWMPHAMTLRVRWTGQVVSYNIGAGLVKESRPIPGTGPAVDQSSKASDEIDGLLGGDGVREDAIE